MKRPWQSKTVWVNVLLAVFAFLPGFSDFTKANPEVSLMIAALVNIGLRLVTKEKIEVVENGSHVSELLPTPPQNE